MNVSKNTKTTIEDAHETGEDSEDDVAATVEDKHAKRKRQEASTLKESQDSHVG